MDAAIPEDDEAPDALVTAAPLADPTGPGGWPPPEQPVTARPTTTASAQHSFPDFTRHPRFHRVTPDRSVDPTGARAPCPTNGGTRAAGRFPGPGSADARAGSTVRDVVRAAVPVQGLLLSRRDGAR